ncbi:LysR family transcriptional regulator [Ectopseudomonas chengduensis]|nr:LysR family transcriptional regulator [Pseudomonas chengduensis]UZT80855.1 LysR family transcriptional regulator [Pseudomonas chengduensis]
MVQRNISPRLNGAPDIDLEGALHILNDQEALAFFLATARCGCFTQAARSLDVKATLLRKKLMQLSLRYGRPLFEHKGNALVLSQDGRHLHNQLLTRRPLLVLPNSLNEEQPLVRLAVAEPLLHDILNRDLLSFLRQHANVRLDLLRLDSDPTQKPVAADIIVWLAEVQPSAPQLPFPVSQMNCLAEVEYVPYVGKRYSRTVSRPRKLSELQDYMLVSLHSYANIPAFQPWNEAVSQRRSGVTRVDAYDLMCQMIQWSACIGLLPHYMAMFDKALQPLPGLFEQRMEMQVWMAVHSDEAHREEVCRLVELIQAAFDEHREWF